MGVVCVVIPHFTLVLRRSANRELDVIFEGVVCVCVCVCVCACVCVVCGCGCGWVGVSSYCMLCIACLLL